MSSTPQFNTGQLQAARAKAWHQSGEPLLTLDAAREWLGNAGLLLFAPRPQHIAAPAPSLVEATLGEAMEAPTAAQSETARSLVARLVSEGNALPLNLLGGPGDLPDFVVSAQLFSFVFTLRGDKLWKQPPSTSDTVKVSPLASAAYELLAARGAMTAPELASELGREVTEAAVMRSLHELWTHLRVIPLLQQGEAATQWELTSRRFTKAIKAGVNAGQPTALSALVSLYLAQALLATEEEVAAFLSPLAARSRIREVVHGLTAARQLEPVVLEGKTLMHIPGTLPEFPAAAEPVAEESPALEQTADTQAGDDGRIKRFSRSSTDRPPRSDFKGKPERSFGAGTQGAGTRGAGARGAGTRDRSARPSPSRFGAKPERSDRERRPFRRDAAGAAGEKPAFTRPWDENRKPRTERPAAAGDGASFPPARAYERPARPGAGGFAKREGYTKRPASDRPERRDGATSRGPTRKSFGDKPPFRKDFGRPGGSEGKASGEGFIARPRFAKDGERKPFVRREGAGSAGSDSRPPRRTFASREGGPPRPERSSGKPGDFAAKRPYVRRESAGADRPAYGGSNSKPREAKPRAGKPWEGAPKRPYVRRESPSGERPTYGGSNSRPREVAPKRPYVRRDDASGERPARPAYGAKRAFGDKPAGRTFGDRPSARPFRSRDSSSEQSGDRPAGRPPRAPGARPGGSGDRGSGPSRGNFGAKPARAGFSKRPGGKVPFGSKAGFSKRPAGGPRPPSRKPKAEE